jgi:hypothetical protein
MWGEGKGIQLSLAHSLSAPISTTLRKIILDATSATQWYSQ